MNKPVNARRHNMEVARDPLREAIHYLETHSEFSKESSDEVIKTIYDNSKLLNTLDPATLSKIKVKLLQIDASSTLTNKIIQLIDRVFTEYSGKIDHLITAMDNEIYFLEKVGSLKTIDQDEYIRAYQNRLTWAFDLVVRKDYLSRNLFDSGFRSLYSMYDKPEDLTKLLYQIKESLENKISKLLIELKKDAVPVASLEKGLNKLLALDSLFSNVNEGINNFQKSSLYDSQRLNLEKLKFEIESYQDMINNEIVELDKVIYFAKDSTSELEALEKKLRFTQEKHLNLEKTTFMADSTREEKFLKNYGSFLSEKSKSQLSRLEQNALKEVTTLTQPNPDSILMNGKPINYSETSINNFIKESELDPSSSKIICKLLSPEAFQQLIDEMEVQSKNNSFSPLIDLNKSFEVCSDGYGNLEIVLKMACGYSFNDDSEVKEFFLVKRSFQISKENFSDLYKTDQTVNFENFKIVDYISPEVKVDEFNFHGRNLRLALDFLLAQFNPTQEWGRETGKLLYGLSKPIPGIDDREIFKGLVMGVQMDLTPTSLSENDRKPNEIGIDYKVPLIVTKDFPRSPLLKLNGEDIFGSFKSGLLTRNEAYAKIAAAFGEDPHDAPLASFACVAISQAVVADFIPELNGVDEKGQFHLQTWDLSLFEIGISENNVLSIYYKATLYDYIISDQKLLNAGHVICRKFQMPIAQLKEALEKKNPELIVDLIAENRLSPSFLIKETNHQLGDPLKIINTEESTYKLNNKEAFELLENFK